MLGWLSSIVELIAAIGDVIYSIISNLFTIFSIIYEFIFMTLPSWIHMIPVQLQVVIPLCGSIILCIVIYKYVTKIT
jgi:hypothetical protein